MLLYTGYFFGSLSEKLGLVTERFISFLDFALFFFINVLLPIMVPFSFGMRLRFILEAKDFD